MSMRRRWLRAILLMMLASATFFGAINPKDIENVLNLMNLTSVEFSLPDKNDNGDDGPSGYRQLIEMQLDETGCYRDAEAVSTRPATRSIAAEGWRRCCRSSW